MCTMLVCKHPSRRNTYANTHAPMHGPAYRSKTQIHTHLTFAEQTPNTAATTSNRKGHSSEANQPSKCSITTEVRPFKKQNNPKIFLVKLKNNYSSLPTPGCVLKNIAQFK